MVAVKAEHVVVDGSIESMVERLGEYMAPFYPLFGREENHEHARMYVEGRLRRLDRRTLEPIANANGVPRRPLQQFVGAGRWNDKPVTDALREQIGRDLGTQDGVLIMDSSGFVKSGNGSVGVQRQWCGRLGKVENCQVGEYLGYASRKGHTLIDFRLYLPQSWANDPKRRTIAHVPKLVKFRKGWELAYEMVKENSLHMPHSWVVGDDAYGRIPLLRKQLDADGERYVLEVPGDTLVRLVDTKNAQTAASVADAIPKKDWCTVRIRDGEKGPVEVRATKLRVITTIGRGKTQERRRETLLLVRRPSTDERWFYLSNGKGFSVRKMARVAGCRHYIEETLELAKGDAGLAHYEVRSWIGWHHHMTLTLLALFFLVRESYLLKKTPPRLPFHRFAERSPISLNYDSTSKTRSAKSHVASHSNSSATNKLGTTTGVESADVLLAESVPEPLGTLDKFAIRSSADDLSQYN